MQFLKANTAVDVLIGPFVDSTNGDTAETALTISQADVRLSKNAQNMAQKSDATAAAHDELGYYNCELDATDTNTEGTLVLCVHESGALPVRHEYMVLAEAAYDSMFTAKDTGFMDVNVKAVSEDTTAADNLESACDGGSYNVGGGSVVAASVTAGVTLANGAVTDASLAGNMEIVFETDFATNYNTTRDAWVTNFTDVLGTYNAQTGDSFAIVNHGSYGNAQLVRSVVPANALAVDASNNAQASVTELQTAAVADLFNTDSLTDYASAVAGSVVAEIADNAGGSALTEAGIADAVWDEAAAGHTDAGKAGQQLWTDIDAILVDTNEVQGKLPTNNFMGSSDAADHDSDFDAVTLAADVTHGGGTTTRLVLNNSGGLYAALVAWGGTDASGLDTQGQGTGHGHYSAALGSGYGVYSLSVSGVATGHLGSTGGMLVQASGASAPALELDPGPGGSPVDYEGTELTAAISGTLQTDMQADPTDFHVNVLEIGGTAQTANDNGADINAILVDVTGLNGDAMRGTDSAALASVCTEARLAELDAGNLPADVATVDGNVDTILVDTADMQPKLGTPSADLAADIAALNDISAADVNTQVSDVLKTDTISEMAQGAPTATPTFEEAVMYVYMALRNKVDVTASLKEFHNNAGTVVWKKTLSDDGTTYSEAEGASGP